MTTRSLLCLAMLAALFPASIRAQGGGDLPQPGWRSFVVADSVTLAGGASDTSAVVNTAGFDVFGYFAQFVSRNDSINVTVVAEPSPDKVHWFAGYGLDAILVSGTGDSSIGKTFHSFPDYPPYHRAIIANNAAADDTLNVTIWWVLHYLRLERLR